jgi:hypothetical protein
VYAVSDPVLANGPLAPDRLAAATPGSGKSRVSLILRWCLGLVGLAQFMLGMAQVGRVSADGHDHGAGVSATHLWHESAAWNIALGAGFGWIALRRARSEALLPLLTAFVAMLVLLSLNDIVAGNVDATRLISHGFVVVGYVALVVLPRPRFDLDDPPAGRRRWPPRPMLPGGRTEASTTDSVVRPPLRLVTRAVPAPSSRWSRAA